jgi:hypothetical protein
MNFEDGFRWKIEVWVSSNYLDALVCVDALTYIGCFGSTYIKRGVLRD